MICRGNISSGVYYGQVLISRLLGYWGTRAPLAGNPVSQDLRRYVEDGIRSNSQLKSQEVAEHLEAGLGVEGLGFGNDGSDFVF